MSSTEDLKRAIRERGVRIPEREAVLRAITESDTPDDLHTRLSAAVENVRARAAKLRKVLE